MNIPSHMYQECEILGLNQHLLLTRELLDSAWNRSNLKYHPNRPGGSAILLNKARKAYEKVKNYMNDNPLAQSESTVSKKQEEKINEMVEADLSASTHMGLSTHKEPTTNKLSHNEDNEWKIVPPYDVVKHMGQDYLSLTLQVPLIQLLNGEPIYFDHLDGKRYKVSSGGAAWGGWSELPGLGLKLPFVGADFPRRAPLLIILQPLFPKTIPEEALKLFSDALRICYQTGTQSLMLQELMPALTM